MRRIGSWTALVVLATVLGSGPVPADERVLTLDEALDLAFRHNPDLGAARHAREGAEAHEGVARAGYLPTLTGTAAYTRQTGNYTPRPGLIPSSFKLSTSPSNQSYDYFNFGITWQQPLYDFGRTGGANDAAGAQSDAAARDVESARQQTWLAVVTRYHTVVAAQEMVRVAGTLRTQAEHHAARARAMVAAGTRPRIEAVRAEAEARAAEAAQLQAQNHLTVVKTDLLAVIGVPEPFPFRVADPSAAGDEPRSVFPAHPPPGGPPLAPVDAAVEEALRNRPDRAALLARIEAQEGVVRSLRGQWFPVLSATASFTDAGTEVTDLVWNWSLGVTLSVPLFTGLSPLYQVREAEAALAALRERLRGIEVAVRRDVKQARAGIEDAEERLRPLRAAVEAAREALALAEGRYEAGTGTSVELLDARAALANAEAALVRGRLDLAVARAAWLRALGRVPRAGGDAEGVGAP